LSYLHVSFHACSLFSLAIMLFVRHSST